ncbi:MAG TPA: hypothetical protein VMF52_06170 [Steroidobacteraceae bacterium]|nr:hypothetical protein [Steroidobacteraceae bacterium]
MNMRNLAALVFSATLAVTLAACGGGGSGSGGAAPMSSSSSPQSVETPPVNSSPAPTTSSDDLALADRLYKGTQRTPAGFDVETRPANVTGTLSTRHLKNTDFTSGQQAISQTYEVCTNDMAQAIAWSEQLATWNGQYSDLVEVKGDSRTWEVDRVPRADTTALIRHRVFRCDYVDRTNTDLRADAGAAGSMNQRPLNAAELEALSEYLWQFTMFNNSDYAVASSSGSSSGNTLTHTIRMGQLVRGANGQCDTVQVSDWTHTMNGTNGSLSRSLTTVRSFKVKSAGGSTESCAG